MAMTINTNIQSLNAQRNLGASQSSLATSMQRLSSGLRINSAKDDAAGLAIASRMQTQITGLNQAQRNANDGVSLAQTAEGALSTIGGNLQRIRELAVQSRNATNSDDDRAALQKEVSQLKEEINRVAETTSFNGTKLLDGTFTAKAFQVGADQGQLIEIASIVNAKSDSLGAGWKSVDAPAVVTGVAPTASTGTTTPGTATLDMTSLVSGGASSALTFKINGGADITVNAVPTGQTAAALAGSVKTAIETALTNQSISGVTATVDGDTVKIENTGSAAVAFTGDLTATAAAQSTTAGGNFAEIAAGALTINGESITVGAATSASQRSADLMKAINSNTALQTAKVTASLDKDGNLSIKSASANLEIDGTDPTVGTGLVKGTTNYTQGTIQNGYKDVDVSSIEGADNAINAMDAALRDLNSARADLGAIQNRFESVVSNLSVNSENLSASKSRIMDADFASETANLSRSQILQQAGTAMVAQANQLPQGVLSLLR